MPKLRELHMRTMISSICTLIPSLCFRAVFFTVASLYFCSSMASDSIQVSPSQQQICTHSIRKEDIEDLYWSTANPGADSLLASAVSASELNTVAPLNQYRAGPSRGNVRGQ